MKLNHSQAKTKPDEWTDGRTEVVKPFPLSLSTIWWNHFHCLCLRSGWTTSTVCLLYSSTIATGTYSNWRGILQYFKKCIQHPINIKIYTTHPHDMVHVPGKFRENTAIRLWVTVRKQNVTDRRTDGQKWWNHSHCLCPLYGETTSTIFVYYIVKPLPNENKTWQTDRSGETTPTVSIYYLTKPLPLYLSTIWKTTSNVSV